MKRSHTRETDARPQVASGKRRRLAAAIQVVAMVAALLVWVAPAGAVTNAQDSPRGGSGAVLWRPLTEIPERAGGAPSVTVTRSREFELAVRAMRARLATAPIELTLAAQADPLLLALPSPAGGFERFTVQEAPVVAAELGARFPFVKTYNGQGIDDPAATIRFDLGRTGFHAQVLSPGGNWYVDPLYRFDRRLYVSYFGRDLVDRHGPFSELEPDDQRGASHEGDPLDAGRSVGSELRTYRTAVAATGEYSTFHGGTVPLVHNAIVTAINRVTGVYERDLAIRLQLVANNDSLIYLNPSSDPYTNTNPSALLTQNQSNVDQVIGNANYDVGHVFSTGGGGLAGLAVVGRSGQKARGETGLSAPTGDAFYIDYVAHEFGHQFGGNHSFNGTRGSCGGNGVSSTAMEPGSGSTIMAYAGICGLDDLQLHSDDPFHAISFDEIAAYTTTPGSPGNLGASPSGNSVPTVSVNGGPFTIPMRTPFSLTATGSDANGDALTYSWEQMDGGALRALDAPSKPTGALFRSFPPTVGSSRTFPRLGSILAGTTNANTGSCPTLPGGLACWAEFLPTAGRAMHFRVSVRDNHASAGGVNSADVLVTSASTGPFLVTSPNTSVSLPGGTPQTITWNVAGSNAPPVNTANVAILLSTDGGNTFPTTLAASTPNDGSQSVTLPGVATSQARVKIQAVGNVFFDVSDANFTITGGGGGQTLSVALTGTGTGTVTSSPAGINCGGDCSETYANGTVVNLVASPGGSSTFSGWSGACTGAGPCQVTMNAPRTVTATFTGTGGTGGLSPTSFTVETGSTVAGTTASLNADDNDYLQVRSTTKGSPRTATWYGTFTGVNNAASSISATYRGLSSTTCTQVISMFRWTTSTWVQLDSRSVGTTEVEVAGLGAPGTPADFVSGTSGTGDVRVRVSCSNPSAAFTLSADLLRLTVGSGGTGGLSPTSFTVETGSTVAGTTASLNADDNDYLQVRSTTKGSPRTATWYGTFTGVNNAASSISATYRGLSSTTCTQVISMFRWTTSTWVQLDSRSVGTTEVEVAGLGAPGTPADFVSGTSGTGDVRVRVSCSNPSAAFTLSADLLRLTVG